MGEYRIDELARLAATTVRNVRVYQDRGLLAPPRRDGRVGIYTDAHLARLRLIGRLLSRGYTFANIGEMLAVWERGGTLAEILDLESAVADPWSDEVPGYVTAEQLGVFSVPGTRRRTGPGPRISAFSSRTARVTWCPAPGCWARAPNW